MFFIHRASCFIFFSQHCKPRSNQPKDQEPTPINRPVFKELRQKNHHLATCLPHQKVRKRILHQEKNVSTSEEHFFTFNLEGISLLLSNEGANYIALYLQVNHSSQPFLFL